VARAGLAAGQKKARRNGWWVVFLDESGFFLHPLRRRTWAPKGKTPVQRAWDRRERLSVISALTLSPKGRLGLYFDLYGFNVATGEVMVMLQGLMRRLCRRPGQKVVFVMDRLPAHRSAAKQLSARWGHRAEVEWLPAYAPDLNPAEQVWDRAKYHDLANYIPVHAEQLRLEVEASITRADGQQHLLRSFFAWAGLKL